MTNVVVTIWEDTVSADVMEVDVWRESGEVGHWQVILRNPDNKWGGDFHANDTFELFIDDYLKMRGYVDDVFPFLGEGGVYENLIRVVGRDYGRDLARLYVTAGYTDTGADDIIQDLLSKAGSEITYVSPGTAPNISIKRRRTYLIDWLRDICKEVNYDFYVRDDGVYPKRLKFFPIDAASEYTPVDLKSVEGALDNNILNPLEKGEELGFSIKNYVEVSAGGLKDHWTDANAVDWTPGAGTYTPVDDSAEKVVGLGSIKFGCVSAAQPSITLNFSGAGGLYSHTALDLSNAAEDSFYVRHNNTVDLFRICPLLEDAAGNIIQFYRTKDNIGVAQKGKTQNFVANKWHKIQMNTGANIDPATDPATDGWDYVNYAGGFNWSNVKKITFKAVQVNPLGPPTEINLSVATDIWLDDLSSPIIIEVLSIVEDAVSRETYGKSMHFEQRTDIKSQIELNAYARYFLAKHKDPLKNLKASAIGQTESNYAGQSLDVQAPGNGIAALTRYRIVKLHHSVKRNAKDGWDFITDYELVKHDLSPTTQVIDRLRAKLHEDPYGVQIESLREARRRAEAADPTDQIFGDTHPISTVFNELGYVDAALPLYDPTGFHDYREEEGWNNYKEAVTFKHPAYPQTMYRLTHVAVQARISLSPPASGELDIKIEYSFNSGGAWNQFGNIIVVTGTNWAEYTTSGNIVGALNQPMWIRFSYCVGQAGEGAVDGYLKECELRTYYKKTRWEPVE